MPEFLGFDDNHDFKVVLDKTIPQIDNIMGTWFNSLNFYKYFRTQANLFEQNKGQIDSFNKMKSNLVQHFSSFDSILTEIHINFRSWIDGHSVIKGIKMIFKDNSGTIIAKNSCNYDDKANNFEFKLEPEE